MKRCIFDKVLPFGNQKKLDMYALFPEKPLFWGLILMGQTSCKMGLFTGPHM